MDIKINIDEEFIDKVINTKENMIDYLTRLHSKNGTTSNISKTITGLKEEIINTWDYEVCKNIIRDMYRETEKYKVGKFSNEALKEMEKEWNDLKLGSIEWPFSAMMFDQYIQGINTCNLTESQKDEKVKLDVVRFRRIKRINTFRNDYIEYLVFETHDNVLPTLKHRRKIDFIINGAAYDQKVSRSVSTAFVTKYGSGWRNIAIEHPEYVAKMLYEQQDEERFGYEPRLLIVYLDSDVDTESINSLIKDVDLNCPMKIRFDYQHKKAGVKKYNTECFVILLHN